MPSERYYRADSARQHGARAEGVWGPLRKSTQPRLDPEPAGLRGRPLSIAWSVALTREVGRVEPRSPGTGEALAW